MESFKQLLLHFSQFNSTSVALHIFLSSVVKVAHYCKVRHIGQINREAPTQKIGNLKTNSCMNVKVGDIIQYYAYKIADVLDKA